MKTKLLILMACLCLTSCGEQTAKEYLNSVCPEYDLKESVTFDDGVVQTYTYYYVTDLIYKKETDKLNAIVDSGEVFYDISNGYNIQINKKLSKDIIKITRQNNIDHIVFEDLFLSVATYHKLVEESDFKLYGDRNI